MTKKDLKSLEERACEDDAEELKTAILLTALANEAPENISAQDEAKNNK